MKRVFLMAVCLMAFVVGTRAQVQFSQFKFFVATLSNFHALNLEMKVKVTSEKNIKYIDVYFVPVNEVGDAITFNDGMDMKRQVIHSTGPFISGKSHKKRYGQFYIYGNKKPTPFPYMLKIDYMGGGSETIPITKENIGTYFPCVKWMDVDYESGE